MICHISRTGREVSNMARIRIRILLTFVIISVLISLVYYTLWFHSSPTINNEFEELQKDDFIPKLNSDSIEDDTTIRGRLTKTFQTTKSVQHSNAVLSDDDINEWLRGHDNDEAQVQPDGESNQRTSQHYVKFVTARDLRELSPPITTAIANNLNQLPVDKIGVLRKDIGHSTVVQNSKVCLTPLFSADGFIRNCITSDVIGQVPADLKTGVLRSAAGVMPESGKTRQESFQKVFDTRAWGHDWDAQYRGLNASGMGATLPWTQEAIAGLHTIISQLKLVLGVKRIKLLDVPCGDMAWMSRFLKTRDDIDYTGVDIVPALIENHRRTFKPYRWKFFQADILETGLNDTYDIILSRTLLQHLYLYDVVKLMRLFSKSGSRYLLTTSWYQHVENTELQINDDNPGRFRQLNLEIPPISLVPPLCVHRDGPPDVFEGWDHFLGLWALPLKRVRRCTKALPFTLSGTDVKFFSCTDWTISDAKHR